LLRFSGNALQHKGTKTPSRGECPEGIPRRLCDFVPLCLRPPAELHALDELAAVAPDAQADRRAFAGLADAPRQVGEALDGFAVELDDDVAVLQARGARTPVP